MVGHTEAIDLYLPIDVIKEKIRNLAKTNEHYVRAMQMSFRQLAAELAFVPWD